MPRSSCVRAAAAAALLAIAGCASTPQASVERDGDAKRFVTRPGAATIYVYRNDFPGINRDGSDSVLYVDRRLIGATLPGTYFRVDVQPGVHVLHGIAQDIGALTINTRHGGLYFVQLNVLAGRSHFFPVSEAGGERALRACCALLENWAPGQRPLFR